MTVPLGLGRKPRGFLLVGFTGALIALSGCSAEESETPSPPAEVIEFPAVPADNVSSVPDPLPEFVTAKGVVLATVIIATGNVSSAIEQGLVSPQEVDLARKAIAEGTVQDWVDAAEKEQAAP